MGRKDVTVHGSSSYNHYMSRLQTDQIYVFLFCIMSYII
jgi:hypothetical protein